MADWRKGYEYFQKKYHTVSDSCVSCKKYAMKYKHK